MIEVVVRTGAIRCVKPQSNRHYQQTNIQFFTGRMPFLSPMFEPHQDNYKAQLQNRIDSLTAENREQPTPSGQRETGTRC